MKLGDGRLAAMSVENVGSKGGGEGKELASGVGIGDESYEGDTGE